MTDFKVESPPSYSSLLYLAVCDLVQKPRTRKSIAAFAIVYVETLV